MKREHEALALIPGDRVRVTAQDGTPRVIDVIETRQRADGFVITGQDDAGPVYVLTPSAYDKIEIVRTAEEAAALRVSGIESERVGSTFRRRSSERGPLRVYVAGGSSEAEECAELIAALRGAGIVVTYDWTPDVMRPGILTAEQAEAQAAADERGIRECEILWYVVPEAKSEGSAWEAGFARGIGRDVIASGPALSDHFRIFTRRASRVFASHAAALDHLFGLARSRMTSHTYNPIETEADPLALVP